MNSLAAVPDGVWAAYATGMMGSVDLFDASDLHRLAVWNGPEMTGTNGIRADLADGILWVSDAMTGALACADPATGAFRALVPRSSVSQYGTSNVVAVGSAVYTGTLNNGLVRVDPGSRCLGSPYG